MFKIFNQVQIETKQACNLKCHFCPNREIEQTGTELSNDLFYKIINELSNLNFQERITLYLNNEPFLDKRLPEFIKETRKKCPNARINTSTNGTVPKYDDVINLFNMGLSDLDISCYNDETYNYWSKLKNYNITLIRIDRNWPHLNNRGGNCPEYGNPNKIGIGNCIRPSIQMHINAWGEAVLCCSDFKREVVMGNIKDNTLIEIWNNEKYQMYRNDLATGVRSLLLCRTCNF